MRATEIIAGGKLFPVRLFCRASNKILAILSGMSASLGIKSPSFSLGLGGDGMIP